MVYFLDHSSDFRSIFPSNRLLHLCETQANQGGTNFFRAAYAAFNLGYRYCITHDFSYLQLKIIKEALA
jgi:hypothetical protein